MAGELLKSVIITVFIATLSLTTGHCTLTGELGCMH